MTLANVFSCWKRCCDRFWMWVLERRLLSFLTRTLLQLSILYQSVVLGRSSPLSPLGVSQNWVAQKVAQCFNISLKWGKHHKGGAGMELNVWLLINRPVKTWELLFSISVIIRWKDVPDLSKYCLLKNRHITLYLFNYDAFWMWALKLVSVLSICLVLSWTVRAGLSQRNP